LNRVVHGPLVAIAIAALATALSACGAGSSTTSVSTGSQAGGGAPGATGSRASGDSPRSSAPTSTTASKAAPAHSAGASAGAASFETQGADNSIQRFGSEASAADLAKAAAALHAFLDARAAGQWAKACTKMAAGVTEALQRLGRRAKSGRGPTKHGGCPQLIEAISAGIPASQRRDLTQAEVGALRTEGAGAFLLYHGAHHTAYFMPMYREGGDWKVAAMSPSALP